MICKTVRSLSEYHQEMENLDQDGLWIFRGQTETSWGLIPSIFRGIDKLVPPYDEGDAEWITRIERDIYREFEKHAIRYGAAAETKWQNLALAQHYGTPTRLLDWTRSATIAAYFAIATYKPAAAAVWCLNLKNYPFPEFLGRITKTYAHRVAVVNTIVSKVRPPFFQVVSQPISHNTGSSASGSSSTPDINDPILDRDKGFMLVLDPPQSEERLRAQEGLFTVYYSYDDYDLVWDLSSHLQELEVETGKNILYKLEIPEDKRETLRSELERHDNMHWHRLFPDLIGLGHWLAKNRDTEFAATAAYR